MEPSVARIDADLVPEPEGPRAHLGESPRWDGAAWWWVDAAAGTVWRRPPGGTAELVLDRGSRVSLCHPLDGGGAVVADGAQPRVVAGEPGDWRLDEPWCEALVPDGWLVNDGSADAAGRLWIGSIHPDRTAGAGQLIMVEPCGAPQVVRDGFTLSNGMAWDAAGTTLWHADSGERVVWAHRIDVAQGRLLDSTVALEFAAEDGLPDGLASDRAGGLWVALYGTGQVRRYCSGRLDLVVVVPTAQTTAVELGGPDRSELLITTAREGFDAVQSAAEPLAGRSFRVRGVTPGLPRPRLR